MWFYAWNLLKLEFLNRTLSKVAKTGNVSSRGYFQIPILGFMLFSYFGEGIARGLIRKLLFQVKLVLKIYGCCGHEFKCVIMFMLGFCEFFPLPRLSRKGTKNTFLNIILLRVISGRRFLVSGSRLFF